jgi:uridine kinase
MEAALKLLELRHYKPNYQPPEENVILRINGSNCGTLGNFCIISGIPKSGKSTFLNAIIASNFTRIDNIFGIKLNTANIANKSIGYFDTESSEYDFYKNLNRIKMIANIDVLPAYFNAFSTRKDGVNEHKAMIETYLFTFRPSVIFIDGLLDLIHNFNDEVESKLLIEWLKFLTNEYNVLIIGVVHLGKRDNHTLGHFGSMVDRYAQSVVEVIKDKENDIFMMKAKYLRSSADFSDICIQWNGTKYVEVQKPPEAPVKRKGS